MTTAVYIVSPSDKISSFVAMAQKRVYEGCPVYVGAGVDDLRSVVFVGGPPLELKRKIALGKGYGNELNALKKRISSMLRSLHIGHDDLRTFIHFGGQGEDEVKKSNRTLKAASDDAGAFSCYAISFGGKFPEELFAKDVFMPPKGASFFDMCQRMQGGYSEMFEHLRSLRIILSCVRHDGKENYDTHSVEDTLRTIFDGERLGWVISQAERNLVCEREDVMKIFHMERKGDWVRVPRNLSVGDYECLMSNLLKGAEK